MVSKAKPPQPSVSAASMSPTLTAAQRADVLREYGLDDLGVDSGVGAWDDGLELDVDADGDGVVRGGSGGGGKARKGGRSGGEKKKKPGLGARVMDDEA